MRNALLLCLILLPVPLGAQAREPGEPQRRDLFRLFAFDFGAIGALQYGGGDSESGWVAWTPSLQLSQGFELRLSAGATMFKSYLGNLFWVEGAELLAHIQLGDSWFLEGGGGAQYWMSLRGGLFPAASAGVGMRADRPFAEWFDRWTALYTFAYISTNPTHELRLLIRMAWPP